MGLRAAGRGRMVGGLRTRARLMNYCFLARSLSALFASLVIRDNVTTRPLIPTPHFLSFSRGVCVHVRVGALLQKKRDAGICFSYSSLITTSASLYIHLFFLRGAGKVQHYAYLSSFKLPSILHTAVHLPCAILCKVSSRT